MVTKGRLYERIQGYESGVLLNVHGQRELSLVKGAATLDMYAMRASQH